MRKWLLDARDVLLSVWYNIVEHHLKKCFYTSQRFSRFVFFLIKVCCAIANNTYSVESYRLCNKDSSWEMKYLCNDSKRSNILYVFSVFNTIKCVVSKIVCDDVSWRYTAIYDVPIHSIYFPIITTIVVSTNNDFSDFLVLI